MQRWPMAGAQETDRVLVIAGARRAKTSCVTVYDGFTVSAARARAQTVYAGHCKTDSRRAMLEDPWTPSPPNVCLTP
jgi:hypothetical protein